MIEKQAKAGPITNAIAWLVSFGILFYIIYFYVYPGPPPPAPLYSRADLVLSPEEETFANEIIAGIPKLKAFDSWCENVDPATIKITGNRQVVSGYSFYVNCISDDGNFYKTVWFNKDKVIIDGSVHEF